jgi:hypothetical protein
MELTDRRAGNNYAIDNPGGTTALLFFSQGSERLR